MIPESAAFHAYVEPARRGGAWWRVLLGVMAIVGTWFGVSIGLAALIGAGALAPLGLDPEAVMAMGGGGRVMPPGGVVVFLLTFLGLWAGLWVAVRLIHRRPFGTLFHPVRRRPGGGPLMRGAALALAFYGVSLLAYVAVMGAPARSALPLSLWAVWIVPIVVCIGVQATAEELLMRGYLLQHFAVWSRNPVVWAVVPSLIFAALHYDGGMEAGMLWRMLVHILIFAFIAAALVWRTGGLGAAVGLHVTNNIFAICAVGMEGSALGFELWLFPADTLERMFAFDLALGALMLAGVFVLFGPEPEREPGRGRET